MTDSNNTPSKANEVYKAILVETDATFVELLRAAHPELENRNPTVRSERLVTLQPPIEVRSSGLSWS